MDPARLSRATLAFAFVVVLVVGALLGGTVVTIASRQQPSPAATPMPSSTVASARALPAADVDGEDFERLPRYPGSMRTEYAISQDDQFRLVAVEYVADADLGEVRDFYQAVIEAQGWQRADITYTGGEWTYLIVDGRTEGLIELEISGGLVEIDLQVSTPLPPETPSPPAQPTPAPTSAPPPPQPAPEDDDGDDGDDFDDSDDDGADDSDG